MRIIVLVVLLQFNGFFCIAQLIDTSVYVEIESLLNQEKFQQAKKICDKHLQKETDNAQLLVLRGRCNSELKQYKDAYIDYTQAIKNNPKLSDAYFHRGFLFFSGMDYTEALNDLNMAMRYVEGDSMRIETLLLRASAKRSLGQIEGAMQDDLSVLELDSNHIGALNNLAMTYNKQGMYDKALECLYKISAIDSTAHFAPMNIGFVLMTREQYTEAIEWFDKALLIDDKLAIPYNNRGYAKFKLGRIDEALLDINKSIKLKANNSYAYRNRALIYIDKKQFNQACLDLNKSKELFFAEEYGEEVNNLITEHCKKK